MPVEPFGYRARKWVVQQFSKFLRTGSQHEELNSIDWDVTIVLDACRWDTLEAVTSWPITYSYSPASATPEWLKVAERTGIMEDAYVATANAQYDSYDLGETELAPVWETDWNNRLGTVLPEPTLERADDFLENDKSPVVAHILPPHAPYVAKVSDTWLPAFPETDIWDRNPNLNEESDESKMSPQVAMASGKIDLHRARRAYEASVASTWDTITDWISQWVEENYTVIVTADHGETFGRTRDWWFCGHPNRCHIDPLVKVPFETFKSGSEPESGPKTVEEKLQALGYVE